MIRTSLIILTRNEIQGVKSVLRKVPFSAVDEYFVVDYKSTDGTIEFLRKHGIPIMQQKKPGRAEGFYLGARKAKGKYLIFFSPDGNEDPSDIPLLIDKLDTSGDLVIASRFMKGSRNEEDGKRLKFRAWANMLFTLIADLLWRGHVTDTINGYRAIKKSAFQKLNLDATGFAIEYQMTIRALKLQMKVIEIPTIEGNRIGGKSTSYAIPTGFRFIYFLLREIVIGGRFYKNNTSFLW